MPIENLAGVVFVYRDKAFVARRDWATANTNDAVAKEVGGVTLLHPNSFTDDLGSQIGDLNEQYNNWVDEQTGFDSGDLVLIAGATGSSGSSALPPIPFVSFFDHGGVGDSASRTTWVARGYQILGNASGLEGLLPGATSADEYEGGALFWIRKGEITWSGETAEAILHLVEAAKTGSGNSTLIAAANPERVTRSVTCWERPDVTFGEASQSHGDGQSDGYRD